MGVAAPCCSKASVAPAEQTVSRASATPVSTPVAQRSQVVRSIAAGVDTKLVTEAGTYNGQCDAEGCRQGRGKFTFPNGDWYDGEWADSKAHGQGTFYTKDSTYTGTWERDMKHGMGEEKFDSSIDYKGMFNGGCRHGHGVLSLKDGSVYDGEFVNNNHQGFGTFTWKNEQKYSGQWSENYMHGQGVYDWPDGSSYDGQYVTNLKDGEGTFKNREGQQLYGMWKDGKVFGKAKFRSCPTHETPVSDFQANIQTSWATISNRSMDGGKGAAKAKTMP